MWIFNKKTEVKSTEPTEPPEPVKLVKPQHTYKIEFTNKAIPSITIEGVTYINWIPSSILHLYRDNTFIYGVDLKQTPICSIILV